MSKVPPNLLHLTSPTGSVIYIGLKGGSMDVHEALHIAAQRRSGRERTFSTDTRRTSHEVNPILLKFWSQHGRDQ
jgi:hypothetical protein